MFSKANFFFYLFVSLFWLLVFYNFHAISLGSMSWLASVLIGLIINGLAIFSGLNHDIPWLRKTNTGKAVICIIILLPVSIIYLDLKLINTIGIIWMWGMFTILGWKGFWDSKYYYGRFGKRLGFALSKS